MNNKQLKRLRNKKKLQKRENVMRNNRPKVTDLSCTMGGWSLNNKGYSFSVCVDTIDKVEG